MLGGILGPRDPGKPARVILDLLLGQPRPVRALLLVKGGLPKVVSCCLFLLNALLDLRKSGLSGLALLCMLVVAIPSSSPCSRGGCTLSMYKSGGINNYVCVP